ncbi:amidohydrolase [Maribacter dokdonensis]|uniref:Amidohydrolase n=2 Tax=Maribacter dokdonensis TaxID=320912 RepID=A0A1H4URV1_9FLAO|nr:amidohydrolase [Maribacter dokdonensis]
MNNSCEHLKIMNGQIKGYRLFQIFILLCVIQFCGLNSLAQNGKIEIEVPSKPTAVESRTEEIFERLVALRRDLHRHPELGGKEKRTAAKIGEYLTSLGLEVKTGIGGQGVVGILRGAKNGRKIAWRADMDALASDSPDVVAFQSTNPGVRHICGHDVHVAIALGIADVLVSLKNQINGTIYFVFQPSEENVRGAKAMIDDGLFEMIDPEEFYALHVTPYPEGIVVSKAGYMFADYDEIELTFESGKDSLKIVEFAKQVIEGLETIEKPEIFDDAMNFGDPEVGLVSPNTIYRDYVSVHSGYYIRERGGKTLISANIGTTDKNLLNEAKNKLEEKLNSSEFNKNFEGIEYFDVTYHPNNDPKLVKTASRSIQEHFGSDTYYEQYGIASGGGDDFALFQEKVSGVYFFLGASDFDKEVIAETHSANFAVDENCIRTGVNIFSILLLDRLKFN